MTEEEDRGEWENDNRNLIVLCDEEGRIGKKQNMRRSAKSGRQQRDRMSVKMRSWRRREVKGGGGMPTGRYLAKRPEALSKGEFEAEMAERKKRKKSIFIRDIRTVGRGLKEEVKGILKKYLGLDVYINKIRAIRGVG